MSDQLKWMNQHMVLLKYRTIGELVSEGGYELPPKYAPAVKDDQFVADFIRKLVDDGDVRTAMNVLAYAIHRRAGIWWGLCCLRALGEEREQAAQQQAQQEAGARQEREKAAAAMAEEAKKQAEQEAALDKEAEEQRKKIEDAAAAAMARIREIKANFTDAQKKIYAEVTKKADDECIKATGMPVQAFVQSMIQKEAAVPPKPEAAPKAPPPAPPSPAPEADDDDAALPPEMRQMLKDKALAVVASWVESPTAEHSVQAEQIAKLIENAPEGMLARAAFWSFGNLSVAEPDGTNVPTPPGLSGNGLRAALLMAMLAPGGFRSLPERAKQYIAIGSEVVCGRNNWTAQKDAAAPETPEPIYRKWK